MEIEWVKCRLSVNGLLIGGRDSVGWSGCFRTLCLYVCKRYKEIQILYCNILITIVSKKLNLFFRKQFEFWSSTPLTSMLVTKTGKHPCMWLLPKRQLSVQKQSFLCLVVSMYLIEEAGQPCIMLHSMDI